LGVWRDPAAVGLFDRAVPQTAHQGNLSME
jgi:hypothetical protein